MKKKHSATKFMMDDLEALTAVHTSQESRRRSRFSRLIFQRFARWCPKPAVVLFTSALIIASTIYTVNAFLQGINLDVTHSISGAILVACTVAGLLLMSVLDGMNSSTSKRGFLFLNPAEISIALIGLFISPAVVLPAAIIGLTVLWIKHPPRMVSIGMVNLVTLTVPWIIVGLVAHTYGESFTGIQHGVILLGCAAIGMMVNIVLSAILSAVLDGQMNTLETFRVFSVELVAFLWLAFAIVGGVAYDPIVSCALVVIGYGALIIVNSAASVHARAHGYRALSFGLTATILHLLSAVDERLQRHSLNTARYTRDIIQATGHNKAVQELAFMAGLLHDIGLAGLGKKLRVAEEEFLRDDMPPEDETPTWWYPPETDLSLSEEDVQALNEHPTIIAQLFKHSEAYGDLPTILARHHDPQPKNRTPFVTTQIIDAIRVADKYESLTAIDGSLPPMASENAVEFLKFFTAEDGELNTATVKRFEGILSKRSRAYQNGTDLTYQESPTDFLDDSLPGPLNLWGMKKNLIPRLSDQILAQYTRSP